MRIEASPVTQQNLTMRTLNKHVTAFAAPVSPSGKSPLKICPDPAAHQVSATLHTVAIVVQQLRQLGISGSAVLRGSRITEANLRQPAELITRAQELTVFSNALERSGHSALGLEVGAAMHLPSYGLLGYVMMVHPTLTRALQCALRFPHLLGSYFRLELRVEGGHAWLLASGYHYQSDLEVFNTDLCLASMWALVCDLMGQRRAPLALHLVYAQPPHCPAYERVLGCQPKFDADFSGLCFPGEWLDRTLQFSEPVSCHMGLQQCEQLEREWSRAGGDSLMARVLRLLYADPRRYSNLDTLATELCLSGRTLRRHLQASQTNFQILLDQAKRDRALDYLQQTQLTMAEIADRLGYAEPASFRQAFRRWTGQSPSQIRHPG